MHFAFTAILSFIVIVGIMVVVHEAGHFLVAKACGVRVEVFSIGFGMRLFGFKYGDTDYRVSLLPLGGYVKMSGEMGGDGTLNTDTSTDANPGDRGDLSAHPRWQRMLIGLAGPAANFVLAFVLVTGLYMMHNEVYNYFTNPVVLDYVPPASQAARAGLQTGDRITRFDNETNPTWEQVGIRAGIDANSTVPVAVERNGQTIQTQLFIPVPKGQDFEAEDLGLLPRVQDAPIGVEATEAGMPAAKAGIKAGDQILSVDGHEFHYVRSMLEYLAQTAGRPVHLVVKRGQQLLDFNVAPIMADSGPKSPAKKYRLGFAPVSMPYHVEKLSPIAAAGQSIAFNVKSSGYIIDVLHRLFTRHSDVRQLSGPIGIARDTGLAVSMGIRPTIELMAMISLNLGIFNLLPFPILDGGMILLLLIEGTIRRDLNQEFKERIYQVAFVVLILFACFVMFNDVTKLAIFSKLKL
jgi:regulator of sigma E protease